MNNQNLSDEYLNSYIDNQLDAGEKLRAIDLIRQSDTLKERVCELSGMKELVRQAYPLPPASQHSSIKKAYLPKTSWQALAACLLLCFGAATGWLTHAWIYKNNSAELLSVLHTPQANDSIAETRKVIVHLSNAHPAKLKATLDETEGLLNTYKRAHQAIQVEVIANKNGVNLLRANTSIYSSRINTLKKNYPNLDFIVCGQTIAKLQKEGANVQLLPQTAIATSAADQINKRLKQGWGYIKI
jgi:intracellular sulfur oxidation DsrE/DsrF family protein